MSSIVMSCLCRLELTTRRRCEEERNSGSTLEHARLCSFQNQHVSITCTPHLGLSSENDISFIYVEGGHHFSFNCISITSSSSVMLLSCCVRSCSLLSNTYFFEYLYDRTTPTGTQVYFNTFCPRCMMSRKIIV